MSTQHWIATAIAASLGAGATGTAAAQEQARVLAAIPVTQQVSAPQQYCSDDVVQAQPRTTGTGAVLGAIIGGVAGNALGGGRHHYHGRHGGYYGGPSRGTTTAIGAIAGGLIGHQVENANSGTSMQTVRRCTTQSGYESQVIGYDVTYEYAGKRYTTRLDYDPGPWMTVDVQPQTSYYGQDAAPSRFVGAHGEYRPAPYSVTNYGNGVEDASGSYYRSAPDPYWR